MSDNPAKEGDHVIDLAKAIEESQRPPPDGEDPSEMWSADLLGFVIVEDDGHGAPRMESPGLYYPHELDAALRACAHQRGRLRHPVQVGVVVPLEATT